MALEIRNGRPYYYRKKRKGNKVISIYVGSGEFALVSADLDFYERYNNTQEKNLERKEQALHLQADNELKYLEEKLKELFTWIAVANGYHKPKRQWRKKR
ncbi:hypothetical protein [Adhaeribacter rhizoryzae]|uniref:Arm DNA-binding domain-containing protein n=1 Tax=Adhaeribacter rhizoryzae TaxID=2607907 RepID=A0A5M6DBA5_9BACT|nr:hypothetical protein [Adhaeribacter rhizoryzae]KAA5542425.1 hypothetical protein F0145_18415 [Adhaeribacter rhizoryzae]